MSEKIQLKEADVDEGFMKTFVESFHLKKLADLAEEEEDTIKRAYLQKKAQELQDMGVKNPKPILYKRQDYEKCYPKSIKYLNENIFMSDTGVYYMNSINQDGMVMPKEMTKEQLNNFKSKFPNDIRVYFEKHCLDVYHVVVNLEKPRIYEKNEISYLNLFQAIDLTAKNDVKKYVMTRKQK